MKRFYLPLKFLLLTSVYGYRVHPVTGKYAFHNGIDLRARHDTVFSVTSGTLRVSYNCLLGIYINVSNSGFVITYGHLSQALRTGPFVEAGTAIAITGSTGRVTGEHLHLSISYNGQPLDPLKFLYHCYADSQ